MTRTKKQRKREPEWRRGPDPWAHRKDVLHLRLPGLTFTWADIIKGMAERCGLQVPEMPPEFTSRHFHAADRSGPFPRTIIGNDTWFEFVPDEMMDLAVVFVSENLRWRVEERPDGVRLLRFSPDGNLSAFDELAGRLMSQTHREGHHRTAKDWESIAGELDRAGFKPADELEGQDCRLLRLYNYRNPHAIQTFGEALSYADSLWVKREKEGTELHLADAVLVRLRRAFDKYRKAHPERKPS